MASNIHKVPTLAVHHQHQALLLPTQKALNKRVTEEDLTDVEAADHEVVVTASPAATEASTVTVDPHHSDALAALAAATQPHGLRLSHRTRSGSS